MADISTTNKKARVPILGENGRISDAYLPQAVIDAEASSKTYAENAKSYSELVKKDAESAASSAASAKESADAAREGISSIDEKVTQAGQFAEAASSSATEANSYLKQVTAVSGTVSGIASSVAENAQVAESFANKSKESAASALTASTNAVNAKVDAEGYRDSAKSYSDNAKADADTAKNILESVKAQKADVDSTIQQFNTDAVEYDTKFNGYVSEAKESKEASAASAASASESAENASTSAVNASASEVKAKTSADAAALSATNAASSAKEVVDNLSLLGASTLTRKEKDTFIHVDDAFPTKLLGIEIEGATEQVTTTGKNLLNCYKLAEIASAYYAVENGNLKVIKSYNEAWSYVPAFITLDAGTYYSSGDKALEIRKASDNSTLLYGEGRFTLDQTTEIKIKVGAGLPSYPVVIKAQIEKGSTATAYEPYTGGKPSPSPEYPQEIKVIENPVVNVAGRNLMKVPFAYKHPTNPLVVSGLTYTRKDDTGSILIEGKKTGTNTFFNLDFTTDAKALRGKLIFAKLDVDSEIVRFYVGFFFKDGTYKTVTDSSIMEARKVPDDAVSYRVYLNVLTTEAIDVEVHPAIYVVENEESYSLYTSQQQAFTLPPEHPYLAKLPDGTADEIVVDREGNVELVARVSKAAIETSQIRPWGKGYSIYEWPNDGRNSQSLSPDGNAVFCDKIKAESAVNIYKGNGIGISVGSIFAHNKSCVTVFALGDGADVSSIDGAVLYYPLMTERRYQLGKIEMPKAQDSIVNAWTDAEVTPQTGVEYV